MHRALRAVNKALAVIGMRVQAATSIMAAAATLAGTATTLRQRPHNHGTPHTHHEAAAAAAALAAGAARLVSWAAAAMVVPGHGTHDRLQPLPRRSVCWLWWPHAPTCLVCTPQTR